MHPFNNEKRKPKLVLLLWMVELPLFLLLKKSGFHLDTLCLKTSSGSDFYKAQSCQKFDDQGVIFPITWDLAAQPGLFGDYLQMLLHHNKTLCFNSLWSLRAEGVQHEHCRNYIDIFTSYNLCWDQLVILLLLLQISSNKSNSSSCVNSLSEEKMQQSRGVWEKKNAPQSWLPASCSSY